MKLIAPNYLECLASVRRLVEFATILPALRQLRCVPFVEFCLVPRRAANGKSKLAQLKALNLISKVSRTLSLDDYLQDYAEHIGHDPFCAEDCLEYIEAVGFKSAPHNTGKITRPLIRIRAALRRRIQDGQLFVPRQEVKIEHGRPVTTTFYQFLPKS